MSRQWWRAVLARVLPASHRRIVLSDFEHEFEERRQRDGEHEASRWYIRHAVASLPGSGRLRMQSWGSGHVIRDLWQDSRYACRQMWKSKLFSVASIAMLTVGLGLVAGAYTLVNGMLFKGWDVPDNARVFRAVASPQGVPEGGRIAEGLSLGALDQLQRHGSQADYAGYWLDWFDVSARPQQRGFHAIGFHVTENFLDVLQVSLQRGRRPSHAPGAAVEVLISERAWTRMFGRAESVLGQSIWLDRVPATIVGVIAPGFDALGERVVEVLVPLSKPAKWRAVTTMLADDAACCIQVIGRRRPGVSHEQAAAELATITAQYRGSVSRSALVTSLRTTAPGLPNDRGVGLIFGLLGAGVVLVWTLTCANVGNLFLARSLRRDREIAIRLSLGASRGRLIRQLLAEGLVLATIAGALAFGLSALVPLVLARVDGTAAMFVPDRLVGIVAAAGTALTCLIVSLAPALQATRIAWKGAGHTSTPSTRGARDLVLTIQIAVALVLVLSATLITRGILRAAGGDTDFALRDTTAVTFSLDGEPGRARREAFARALHAYADSHAPVGVVDAPPVSRLASSPTSVQRPGAQVEYRAYALTMTPASLAVLRIPLVQGRLHANDPAAQEAIVNESLARRLAADGDVLGATVRLAYTDRVYTVVGVTRDAHLVSLGRVEPMIHVLPVNSRSASLLLPTTNDLPQRMEQVQGTLGPGVSVSIEPLSQSVRQTLDDAWVGAATAGGLGLVALLLAIVGVFGVFSYLIEERRREIGVRLALGASRSHVRRALAVACRWPLLMGLGLGLLLSLAASQALRTYLFGLSPIDIPSYAVAALVLTLSAVVATAVPVRRALNVDPVVVLKSE